MPERMLFNFVIDPEMREALRRVKDRDGISESEQVRRAIRAWLETKGIKLKGGKPQKRR